MQRVTSGMFPPSGPPEEPTYRCPDCLDHAYTSHEITRHGVPVPVSWFCDCAAGRSAQAGYWFDDVYPQHGMTRVHSDSGQKRLADYLSAKSHERIWLPGAIEHLRQKHEEQRKRKLSAMEGA